jgi:dTDP-4-amino-4,6-dideoxygalactose transaminase
LLALLLRRLTHPQPKRLEWQTTLGNRLLERIQPPWTCPGTSAGYHHYWVFPVLTDHPRELLSALGEAGFDATQGDSMRIIEKPEGSPALEPDVSRDLLKRMVYVPMYPELTRNAVEKMAEVLLEFFAEHPNREVTPSIELNQATHSLTGVAGQDS